MGARLVRAWDAYDRRKGLEARRPYQEPVGAWFSHVGGLHTVFHIWEYPSLEEREKTRAAAWQVEVCLCTATTNYLGMEHDGEQGMHFLPRS